MARKLPFSRRPRNNFPERVADEVDLIAAADEDRDIAGQHQPVLPSVGKVLEQD